MAVEGELLASCFIACAKDPQAERDQKEKVLGQGESDENEVDVLNREKKAFKEEFNRRPFTQERSWEVLQKYAK
ncbi:hypothetical protein Tco_0717745 [Tanacetum coccineum]